MVAHPKLWGVCVLGFVFSLHYDLLSVRLLTGCSCCWILGFRVLFGVVVDEARCFSYWLC
jgi:hypothetical protein